MRRADWAKFTQNPVLGARLLETKEAELVEDSPCDAFWGTGPNGDGIKRGGPDPYGEPRSDALADRLSTT